MEHINLHVIHAYPDHVSGEPLNVGIVALGHCVAELRWMKNSLWIADMFGDTAWKRIDSVRAGIENHIRELHTQWSGGEECDALEVMFAKELGLAADMSTPIKMLGESVEEQLDAAEHRYLDPAREEFNKARNAKMAPEQKEEDDEPEMDWQSLEVAQPRNEFSQGCVKRCRVPGGWLIAVLYNPPYDGGAATCFLPDPDHRWDGSSLDGVGA